MTEQKKKNTAQEMGEEEATPPSLHSAILQISSLISHSHSIKVFTAKWQSIRCKLQHLLSDLTAVDKSESSHIPSLPTLLLSISATLDNCGDLAKQCSDLSYAGKLLTQSNLDIVSARIDAHIEKIPTVYSAAVAAPSPSSSASREDVRFYAVDLLSKFKIGSAGTKKEALISLNDAIEQDERYLNAAMEFDSFAGFLVEFLDSDDGEIQREAAKAVFFISGFDSYKRELIGAGLIPPLIRAIESQNQATTANKELAAKCLLRATENSENAWSVSSHGGVTALLNICGGGAAAELVALACGVLKNLVGVQEIKRFIVEEEGGIAKFIELAKSKDESIKISSVDLLQTMAFNDESTREAIIGEGGIRALVKVFSPKSPFSNKTRELALKGIVNICCSSQNSLHLLLNYGFMDHILYFLRHGEASVQELSLKTAFWLSGSSEEAKRVMGEAGFMPVLVKFLDSKSVRDREMAAETITSMIMVPKNRRKFVQSEQGLGFLLRMLDPLEVNCGNKKLLLSILMSLIGSSSARRKIASSGYLKNIEKLAEAQVSDAKKIVRKVSSTRIGSFLNGMWHSS